MEMMYTVYQITNTLNGKTYIGCHKTKNLDDGYMGSGKYLKRSQAKHGLGNFHKEILHVFNTSEDMFAKEEELIAELKPEYNLHKGGLGGWDYVNSSGLGGSKERVENLRSITAASNRKRAQERYDLNPPHCKWCSTALDFNERTKLYCSPECRRAGRAEPWNKGKTGVLSPEVRAKISSTLMARHGAVPKLCMCGKRIAPRNKSCIEHIDRTPANRIIDPLEYPKIAKLRESINCAEIGRRYGVAEVTIRKVIQKYKASLR